MLTARVPEGAQVTARFLKEGYIRNYFGVWYTGGTGNVEEIADYTRMRQELQADRAFSTRNDLQYLPELEKVTGKLLMELQRDGKLDAEDRNLASLLNLPTLEKRPAQDAAPAAPPPAPKALAV
jgi:hypothetical protein